MQDFRPPNNELEFYRFALDQASIVAITDARGRITHANEKFCAISKYSRDELIGHDHRILNSGHHSKSFFKNLYATIARGEVWQGQICNRAKDGTLYWVDTTIVPARDENGKISRYFAIRTDVTEKRHAEEDLRRLATEHYATKTTLEEQARVLKSRTEALSSARVAADSAAKAKNDFLANMSHEFRTPMTAILGFADLLDDAETTPHQRREYIATIQRNGRNLLALMNELLDIASIEAGTLALKTVNVETTQIVNALLASQRDKAIAKGLTLRSCIQDSAPASVTCDPARLGQILVNLVGNAIKFTPHGSVRLDVSAQHDAVGVPQALFAVTDTGIGIDAKHIGNLFNPFTQVDPSMSRKFGGSGLGLSLSRELARAMGGDITVSSRPGSGSVFTLTVPAGSPQAKPAATPTHGTPAPTARVLTGRRLLIAEDGPDNQRLISFHLRAAGAQVQIVPNGQDAVETALENLYAESPFDLVLMDMQMPVLDGYEATAKLRRCGYRGKIVALTAHALESDRARCLAAGCDEYLSKPIDRARLITLCSQVISAPIASEAA